MHVRNGKQAMLRRQEVALANRKKNLSSHKSSNGSPTKASLAESEIATLEKRLGL